MSLRIKNHIAFAQICSDYNFKELKENHFLVEAILRHYSIPFTEELIPGTRTSLRCIREEDYQTLRETAASEYYLLGKTIPSVLKSYRSLGSFIVSAPRLHKLYFIADHLYGLQRELGSKHTIPKNYSLIKAVKPRTEDHYYLIAGGLVGLILKHQEWDDIYPVYRQKIEDVKP